MDGERLLTRFVQLPQRLLLRVVAGGVIAGLAIASGAVWLSARRQRREREEER